MQPEGLSANKTVALYLRVSTEEQAKEGTSIKTQEEFLWAWAKLEGLDVFRVYSDPGYSGSSEDRPDYQQMLRDAKDGHFQGVAVNKLDRFMRDARLLLNAIEVLDEHGVAFIAVKEGVDTRERGAGRLILTILAAIAEWERDRIQERTTEGRIATARKGGLLGGFVPYGYKYVAKTDKTLAHYEIDEGKAAVVVNIYSWQVEEQMSCRGVAVRLKDYGIKSPSGKLVWAPGVINHLLRQEVYCGTAYYRRHSPSEPQRQRANPNIGNSTKSSRRLRPREDWIEIPVPPIVDRHLWDRAQEQLLANSKFSPRNSKRQYLLRELLRCGVCGKAYSGYAANRRGRDYRYYGCTNKETLTAPDGKKCPGRAVPAGMLEELTWDTISGMLSNPSALIGEFKRRQSQPVTDGVQDERRKLESEIKRLRAQADRFLDLYGEGRYDRNALDDKMDLVNAQLRVAEERLDALGKRTREAAHAVRALEDLETFCATVSQGLDNLNFNERQMLLRLVIDRAIICSNNKTVSIELAVPLDDPQAVYRLRPTRPTPSPP